MTKRKHTKSEPESVFVPPPVVETTIEERIDAAEAGHRRTPKAAEKVPEESAPAASGPLAQAEALVAALCDRCTSGLTVGLAELRKLQQDVAALRGS